MAPTASYATDNACEFDFSLPGYKRPVRRYDSLEVTYLNEDGRQVKEEISGFGAIVVQHEVDHLDGILFIDR